jgi:hypothetical protein
MWLFPQSLVSFEMQALLRGSPESPAACSFLAISRKVFSKSAHFVRVQKILLEVYKTQAISRKAFAKSAHFVRVQKILLEVYKIKLFWRAAGSIPTPAMLKVTQGHIVAGSAAELRRITPSWVLDYISTESRLKLIESRSYRLELSLDLRCAAQHGKSASILY